MTEADVPTESLSVWIDELTVGNLTVRLPSAGVVAVVGGNNAGKSTLLRQINNRITLPQNDHAAGDYRILHGLRLAKEGTSEQFREWVLSNVPRRDPTRENPIPAPQYARAGGPSYSLDNLTSYWKNSTPGRGNIGELVSLFYTYMPAGSKVEFAVGRRQRPGLPPGHVLHYLEDDPNLRSRVDDISKDVFGVNLTLDMLGQTCMLRVGKPPGSISPPGYYDDPLPFAKALDELRPLGDQGDGMQAFFGKILPIVTAAYQIVVMDEPEAFLHPPQAIRLGQLLGRMSVESGVQVMLATHDRNIIVGLLDSNCPLSVIRLSREEEGKTRAHLLDPSEIAAVWSDPVLRYSHVLDGLFHSRVVVVENERDCTFYAAALDAAHAIDPLAISPSEVLFVPTNGKDGIAPVVRALGAIGVPVVASPDIDILNDENKIRKLIEHLGGDWAEFGEAYRIIASQFKKTKSPVPFVHVATSIDSFIKRVVDGGLSTIWSKEHTEELRALTRVNESPWAELKKYGVDAFDRSVDKVAIDFLDRLDRIGLVVVRVGELEGFARGYGIDHRKGTGWIRAALESGVHSGVEAVKHARKLCSVEAVRIHATETN